MAEERFQFLTERAVAKLPLAAVRRGARIEARSLKLQKQFAQLKKDREEFDAFLESQIPSELKEDEYEGFRVEDDGTLFQVLCRCVECQARLQGLSPTETAEAMIRAKLVAKKDVESTRAHAYQLELMQQQEKRDRLIWN